MQPIIVWLRNDLRLTDNPALFHAAKKGAPLVLIYIFDHAEHDLPIGKSQKIWLHHSLKSLQKDLREDGHQLYIFKGNAKKHLIELVHELEPSGIYWNRCYEPKLIERDIELKKLFKEKGLDAQTFSSFLLFEPWTILNQKKESFKVFTPFWKTCSSLLEIEKPLSKPKFTTKKIKKESLSIEELSLLSKNSPDFSSIWNIGEEGAQARLRHFLKHGLEQYADGRDIPSIDATSKLSPNLHFGEISPKQIVYAVEEFVQKAESKELKKQKEKFFSELGWREFSYHLLYHFPKLPKDPFKPQYGAFPWKKSEAKLQAWQAGMTGFPIIDAGMRQLVQTGWMHNRVRMVVASFLVKNCMIHWHEGEDFFWEHLVDADLANNSASWQWVFGSGADAAPYFRVFNPILQSQKFDPEGIYIKTYVPELKELDPKYLHDPSSAPSEILRQAGITLGVHYPKAICDLIETRDQVLEAYKEIQQG
jgi:deoxyribodipyrimidine photo-lyase